MAFWIVRIQDKTQVGEPDIGFAIVDVPDEETAIREADSQLASLIGNGFYRCVAHAKPIELGRFYRARALVNPAPSAAEPDERLLDPRVTGNLPATLLRLEKNDLLQLLTGGMDIKLQRRLIDALGLIDPDEADLWDRALTETIREG